MALDLSPEEGGETVGWWVAPISGEYYLGVDSNYGTVGRYRLIISDSDS